MKRRSEWAEGKTTNKCTVHHKREGEGLGENLEGTRGPEATEWEEINLQF